MDIKFVIKLNLKSKEITLYRQNKKWFVFICFYEYKLKLNGVFEEQFDFKKWI